jgi:small subunit ribosomal protein S7
MKHAPSVLKDPTATPGSKREYSTLTGFGDGAAEIGRPTDILPVQVDAVDINPQPVLPEGAKYPLPDLPLPPTSTLRKRYSPVVEQVTSLIMRDGKV